MSEANQYIQAVDEGVERVLRIEAHMHEALQEWERKPYVEALMAFRGFKMVAAMTAVAELGDLSRFAHPRQLMGLSTARLCRRYLLRILGVVPGEDSTGERRRQGAITKTGNGHARWMLIECASHYIHASRVSPQLSARQKGQSREVRSIAWRAQNRLNYRFKALSARRLNRNKVVVAVAREPSGAR